MLKIFNNLAPFFQDSYRRINVREYSRLTKVSPPTASKILTAYKGQGLLRAERERNYIYYCVDRKSSIFPELHRTYWKSQLTESGLLNHLEKELVNPVVVLFGSFSKAEVKKDSDIDLAVFSVSKKKLNLVVFEKNLKRRIHLFVFADREKVASRELLNNILNGVILLGGWS